MFEEMQRKDKIEVGPSYSDYLIKRGKTYQEKREEKKAKQEAEDVYRKECTFSPNVQASKRENYPNVSQTRQPGSASKWEELYH